ncbi:hypothetical protein WN944_027432 [Citrus x changshan-huyou]|uniref:Uncharacterized protein n=1 Tax=Citrus x changshan-huyou TaxID=2935761 RepID=A0AAP0LII5_9ROSI
MGTEHLLEAVVSRANSVSKQISDDNVSCRTTVTQISISSIPTISPSSGQGESVKPDGSVSTANSKKNDETTKSNRKRLKPGENPRPRPKDHQMIQGSAKEAQEIVPKGTKRTWTSRTYHQAHAVLAECDKARCRRVHRLQIYYQNAASCMFESQGSRLCWENLCLPVRARTSNLGCGTGLKVPPTVGALPRIPRD